VLHAPGAAGSGAKVALCEYEAMKQEVAEAVSFIGRDDGARDGCRQFSAPLQCCACGPTIARVSRSRSTTRRAASSTSSAVTASISSA
jgi:hypothetical protein